MATPNPFRYQTLVDSIGPLTIWETQTPWLPKYSFNNANNTSLSTYREVDPLE